MTVLDLPPDLRLSPAMRDCLGRVCRELSPFDFMYEGNARHYLECGASALDCILASLRCAAAPGSTAPSAAAILDFGGGAGRVMRWLGAAFPGASLSLCDLHPELLAFAQRAFGCETWLSSPDFERLQAPRQYNLIWVGSVFTHLPAPAAVRLLRKLTEWLAEGGVLVASFCGRYALSRQDSGSFRYIDDPAWRRIRDGCGGSGYGYADYPGQAGFGIAVASPAWLMREAARLGEVRIVAFSEKAWDDHLDILALQRTRFLARRPDMPPR